MIVVGIDPGVHGGVVALRGPDLVASMPLPMLGPPRRRRLDAPELWGALDLAIGHEVMVLRAVVELPIAMPGRSSVDTMTSGMIHGAIVAAMELRGWPVVEVDARQWQREMGRLPSRPSTKGMTRQCALAVLRNHRKALKAETIARAARECPALRGAHAGSIPDGIADAYWIARYGLTLR